MPSVPIPKLDQSDVTSNQAYHFCQWWSDGPNWHQASPSPLPTCGKFQHQLLLFYQTEPNWTVNILCVLSFCPMWLLVNYFKFLKHLDQFLCDSSIINYHFCQSDLMIGVVFCADLLIEALVETVRGLEFCSLPSSSRRYWNILNSLFFSVRKFQN